LDRTRPRQALLFICEAMSIMTPKGNTLASTSCLALTRQLTTLLSKQIGKVPAGMDTDTVWTLTGKICSVLASVATLPSIPPHSGSAT
ncbi:hypothetical protein KIPB_015830, partial [Kipferlia bialata]